MEISHPLVLTCLLAAGCRTAGAAHPTTSADCPRNPSAPQRSSADLDALADLEHLSRAPEIVLRVLATGDPALRESAASRLVLVVTVVSGSQWREAQRPLIAKADALSKLQPTPPQLDEQLDKYQLGTLERLYRLLSALGGDGAADYAFSQASDSMISLERRLLALELAENLQRAGARRHADQLPALSAELRQPRQ